MSTRRTARRLCFAGLVCTLAGCQTPPPAADSGIQVEPKPPQTPAVSAAETAEPEVPRPLGVDRYNFTPVDRYLATAPPVVDDEEGSLNPYVLRVIEAYPKDGSYPYRCLFSEPEYDIYNGVTQNLWYQGRVVAKAFPDGSHCSYCCGLTFEVFVRAMKLRNEQKGLPVDDFNGMDFYDLFNLLQLWYIEGKGDSPQRGIVAYGLGPAIIDWEQARAGDFCDFSRNNKTGHSVVFIDWVRGDDGAITGMKYFSSNQRGGPTYATEYFSDSGGKLLREWVRLAHVGSIEDYQPFDRTQIPRRKAYAP